MNFYVWSDVHNEFGEFRFNRSDYNPRIPLIIAGDWGTAKNKYTNLLKELCEFFDDVIIVLGNHDYYGGSIKRVNEEYNELSDLVPEFVNLHFLNGADSKKRSVEFYSNGMKITILGCTLWTDIDGGSHISTMRAPFYLNDFNYIEEFSTRKVNHNNLFYGDNIEGSPQNWLDLNKKHVEFLREEVIKIKSDNNYRETDKILIVTHFAPHELCVQEEFKGSDINCLFHCTGLDDLISEVDGWVHGHMHAQDTIFIGEVPIIRNARGYHKHEKQSETWNPSKIFEI